MAAYYKEQKTLWQVLGELEKEYGIYTEKPCSFAFLGTDGFQQMCGMMEWLRNEPPKMIAALAVRQIVDYRDAERTGFPVSDVLAFHLEDGSRVIMVIIRTSGTEPKMKAYFSVKTEIKAEGNRQVAKLESKIEKWVYALRS